MLRISVAATALTILGAGVVLAQEPAPVPENAARSNPVPVYRVTVVEHGIDAVNYQYRSDPTKIDFRGTVLLPDAKGEATVQSRRGRTEIEAKFEKLAAPSRFGREYLTYVLWALSPEGAPHNLGELVADQGDHSKIRVTTDLQAFAMIVTAEPYSSVREPSQVVVLENRVRPDTAGRIQPIHPRPELFRQGTYTMQVGEAVPNTPKVSMSRYEAVSELYQAQNAVALAQSAGAERYAPEALASAQRVLAEAQRLDSIKGNNSKMVVQNAREAEQSAEDARLIAERRKQQDDLASAEQAKAQAETEARQARAEAQAARAEADRLAHDPPAAAGSSISSAPESGLRSDLMGRIAGSFAAQDTPRGLVITLPDGDFDGINLLNPVSQKLTPIGSTLAAHPEARIDVEAHSGSTGNALQSWERAQAVRNVLVASGVPANRVSVRNQGAQANGPVEIVIVESR